MGPDRCQLGDPPPVYMGFASVPQQPLEHTYHDKYPSVLRFSESAATKSLRPEVWRLGRHLCIVNYP